MSKYCAVILLVRNPSDGCCHHNSRAVSRGWMCLDERVVEPAASQIRLAVPNCGEIENLGSRAAQAVAKCNVRLFRRRKNPRHPPFHVQPPHLLSTLCPCWRCVPETSTSHQFSIPDHDRNTLIRMVAFEHVRKLREIHDYLTATELSRRDGQK